MKASVLHGEAQPLRVEEVQIDQPGAREVLIRTGASGVCHSDLHFVNGHYGLPLPSVPGHEAAGTIEAVGDRVTYVQPGDHVITCTSVFCGHCERCLSGQPVHCANPDLNRAPSEPPRLRLGDTPLFQFARLATFAEQMLVHENAVVKVRQDVPFEQFALVGCAVMTGVGAVLNTAKVEPGATVAVIGCGGIGLNCVQGAALAGALRIIAVDTVETKLAMAREFGATDVIDASGGGVVEKVRELIGGVEYSFEAIGTKETVEQAYQMLAPGGTATIVRVVREGTKVEWDAGAFLRWGERKIQGSRMGSNRFRIDMPRYIELYLQGRLKLDELVSQRIGLDQVDDAFRDMEGGHVARSVITFD